MLKILADKTGELAFNQQGFSPATVLYTYTTYYMIFRCYMIIEFLIKFTKLHKATYAINTCVCNIFIHAVLASIDVSHFCFFGIHSYGLYVHNIITN